MQTADVCVNAVLACFLFLWRRHSQTSHASRRRTRRNTEKNEFMNICYGFISVSLWTRRVSCSYRGVQLPRGAQITGTMLPVTTILFFLYHLIFVGHPYGIFCVSLFWRQEFWGGSYIFGKSVHPCCSQSNGWSSWRDQTSHGTRGKATCLSPAH